MLGPDDRWKQEAEKQQSDEVTTMVGKEASRKKFARKNKSRQLREKARKSKVKQRIPDCFELRRQKAGKVQESNWQT